jgi:hypothetical protein
MQLPQAIRRSPSRVRARRILKLLARRPSHREQQIASCKLPLTVRAFARKDVADLDCTEHGGTRAQQHAAVILDCPLKRAIADLRGMDVHIVTSKPEEQVDPMHAC